MSLLLARTTGGAPTQTLTVPLIASGSQVFGPNVIQVITPPIIASGSQTFAPSVVQIVQPPLIASGSVTFVPSVIQVVQPPLAASTSQTFAPSVVQIVQSPLIGSTEQIFPPTLIFQQFLQPSLLAATSTTFTPNVIQVVQPPVISSTEQLFAPSIVQAIQPPVIASGSQIFAPVVANLNTLVVPFIANGSQLFAPSIVEDILPPFIASGSQIFAPNVIQNVQPPVISSASQTFAPSLTTAYYIQPGLLGPNSQLFAPVVANLNILVASFINSASQTFAPSIVQAIQPPVIGSTEQVFSPRLSFTIFPGLLLSTAQLFGPNIVQNLGPARIESTTQTFAPNIVQNVQPGIIGPDSQTFAPSLTNLNTLAPSLFPSSAQLFAPTVRNLNYILPPFLGTAVVYPPSLIQGQGLADFSTPTLIPLIEALELPLPETLTRIYGIHQSDVIIRSAIQVALADIRANPNLLNYVLGSLPQDPITWKGYGEKDIQQAKEWFLTTNIPVSIVPRMDEGKFPLITIELTSSTEVTPESTLGDIHYEPEEDSYSNWPVLTPPFTPLSYLPSTGKVTLVTEPVASVFPGMFLVDRNGIAHEILSVISTTEFYIANGTVADLRGAVLKPHRPSWKIAIESSSFIETYRIGLYVQDEPMYLSWLHSIVVFALLRYKQSLLEGRGFERSTIASTQMVRDGTYETENIFSRYINITGNVRQYWPKTFAQVIDGVEFDENGLKVSGDGVDVGDGGVEPATQLWTGNDSDDDGDDDE